MRSTTQAALVSLVIVAAGAVPADAGPGKPVTLGVVGAAVTPPDGWRSDAKLSRTVLEEFDKNARIPGHDAEHVLTGGGSWTAPAGTGAALHVLWMVGNDDLADIPGFVRAQLSDASTRAKLAETAAGTVEIVSWTEQVGERQAGGTIEHRQTDWGTRTLSRVMMFVDGKGHWHELRVECVMRDDESLATTRPQCEGALASVQVTVPEAERRALGAVPSQASLTVVDEPPDDAETDHDGGAAPLPTGASMRAGGGGQVVREAPLSQAAPPAEERRTSRLMLVGGGVLVLIALALTVGRRKGKAE